MSDQNDSGRGDDVAADGTDAAGDIGAADAQALRAMFAALVEDAAPSELSPLHVQRLARAEQRAGLDKRVKRLKFLRNALVAAVLAGIVALLVPRLDNSTNTASSSSSSSSSPSAAAGTSAASAPAGAATEYTSGAVTSAGGGAPAAGSPASALSPKEITGGGAPAGSSSAGSSSAGTSSASSAAAGTSAGSGSSASSSSAASSGGAPSSGAMSSAAASSGGSASGADSGAGSSAPVPASGAPSTVAACLSLSKAALADLRAALPGYRGAIRIEACVPQVSAGTGSGTVTFTPTNKSARSCPAAAGCRPVPGTTDAYSYRNTIAVVGQRAAVTVTATPGGPDRQALIAAARMLLKEQG